MNRLLKGIFFSVLVLLMACDTDTLPPATERVGFDYFPLIVGEYQVYDVREIEYTIFGEIDTTDYQLRTEVIDSFENQTGSLTYLINRYQRVDENEEWQLLEVWSARRNANQAVLVEGNVPFIKLSFPVDENRMWDGNALNTLDQDEYLMNGLESAFTIKTGETVGNTVTVVQSDNEDYVVQLDERTEIYGAGIGLLSRESTLLNFCTTPECLASPDTIINTGIIFKQEIIEYGKE